MARNVDGEFEVLLGNKQLLSVFFIVLILMAVFFTMGYVLGRDSASRAAFSRQQAPVAPPSAQSQLSGFPNASPGSSPAAPATQAVRGGSQAGTQPQQLPASDRSGAGSTQPPAAQPPSAPAPGQVYLQAIAGNHADAELVANVLRKKGFPVVLAPGPTEGVLRVLVGPIEDDQTLRKTRADLEAAGVKPFTRRY